MTGRNDECHCGSGLKYKKCCLAADQRSGHGDPPPDHVGKRDIPGIIHLLETRMGDEFRQAMIRMVTPDCAMHLPALSEDDPALFESVHIAIVEAAVALMARAGAAFRLENRLSGPQARYMDQLASNTMRIWRVVEVRPGQGMTVEEVETGHREVVVEASGSRTLVPWQLVAARVLHDMPFTTFANLFLLADKDLDRYRNVESNVLDPDVHAPEVLLELALVRDYVRRCVRPESIGLVDVGSGAPVEFVHDRFTLLDEPAFRRTLEMQDDVDLDPENEDHWIRFQELDEESSRVLCHLESAGNVLQMISRSRKAAAENRAWLKRVCGTTMKFRSRRIDDPHEMVRKAARDNSPRSVPVRLPKDSWETMYRQQYKDWADSPLPLFGGRTPREMARTPEGRRDVLDLVRSYQAQEHRMARGQEREPIDLSWMLHSAGMDATLG